MRVHSLVSFYQLFFAEFAVLVGVQLLEEVLEFFDIIVVDDVGYDEGEDGLN